jgi:Fic-DOC domain mobile mystery protein B
VAEPIGAARDDGQTPLDPDESEGLLLPVATRGALNAVEADNIAEAVAWLASRGRSAKEILREEFVRGLHERMLGQVWSWAGEYRRTDKSIGVPWTEVRIGVRRVLGDADAWIASGMDPDEAAARLGHRTVLVHPFANGNGRHSRLLSDCLAEALGRPVFTWGAQPAAAAQARGRYLDALRAADGGDIAPLVSFARS